MLRDGMTQDCGPYVGRPCGAWMPVWWLNGRVPVRRAAHGWPLGFFFFCASIPHARTALVEAWILLFLRIQHARTVLVGDYI